MEHQSRARPVLAPAEQAALDELRGTLARDFRLVSASLFGSKARGDSGPESDLDVVVVLEECDWETERRVYELCFEVGVRHDVLISPVVFARQEYEARRTRATPFYRLAAADGVFL